MSKKQHTSKGQPITDEQIERLAAEAEAGYDLEKLRRPRRPQTPRQRRSPRRPSGSTLN
jgi:hypothetical protein